jgi:hypothetical protein
MTRGFMFADASAGAEVDSVRRLMDRMFAGDEPRGTTRPTNNSRVASAVWLSNLVAWVTRRASSADVANQLELTIGLLLGHKRASDAFGQ